jgi:hypothetical protein
MISLGLHAGAEPTLSLPMGVCSTNRCQCLSRLPPARRGMNSVASSRVLIREMPQGCQAPCNPANVTERSRGSSPLHLKIPSIFCRSERWIPDT